MSEVVCLLDEGFHSEETVCNSSGACAGPSNPVGVLLQEAVPRLQWLRVGDLPALAGKGLLQKLRW